MTMRLLNTLVILLLTFLIVGCSIPEETPVTITEPPTETVSDEATITASPDSVSMTAMTGDCYPSYCTVFQNIIITSTTPWTSTPPGFGSLREGFVVSPDFGPAGSTTVAITYRYQIPEPNNGFIRFRTTTIGVYAEVPVMVIAK